MTDTLFVDSDIILDLLLHRDPFFDDAGSLMTLVEEGYAKAFTSPLIYANLYYILRKLYPHKKVLEMLGRLKTLIRVLPIGERIIEISLSSEFADFEDSIQYYTALDANMEYFVTRNKRHYPQQQDLVICTAAEYVSIIESQPEQ